MLANGTDNLLPMRLQRVKYAKVPKNSGTKKRTSSRQGGVKQHSKEVIRPYSIDSDDFSDQAPRIDDIMSAKKKPAKMKVVHNYQIDAICLLADRLEL